MNEEKIHAMLNVLGCRKIRTKGQRVWSTCPFEYLHDGGIDRKPYSFKVEIKEDGKSQYYCFACHETDSLEWLCNQRGILSIAPSNIKKSEYIKPLKRDIVINEKAIKKFAGFFPRYIKNRGIDNKTAYKWRIGYDRASGRATFPYWCIDKKLRGVVGRIIHGDGAKYLCYSYNEQEQEMTANAYGDGIIELNKSNYLYGEHLLKKADNNWLCNDGIIQNIVLVEGHIDVVRVNMALKKMGFIALGVQGSYFSEEQETTIKKNVSTKSKIFLMFDGDKAGRTLTKDVNDRLISRGYNVYIVNFNDGEDPGDLELGEIRNRIENNILK